MFEIAEVLLDTARGLLTKELAIAKGVGEDKISGEIDAMFAPAAAITRLVR